MKIIKFQLYITLILTGFLSAIAQDNSIQYKRNWLPDTVFLYNTDVDFPARRDILEYNTKGLLELNTIQQYKINSWENFSQNSYSYDSNNNLLSEMRQRWENNSWIYIDQITRTYDFNNNLLTEVEEINGIKNGYSTEYTYDSNSNILTKLWQRWEEGALMSSILDTFIYDTNNNIITELSYSFRNNSWIIFNTINYSYDCNNNILTKSDETSFKYTYTYDSNNNLLTELYSLKGSPDRLTTYTYDLKNNVIYSEMFIKEYENDELREFKAKTAYSYDSNNNLLSKLRKFYNNDTLTSMDQYLMTYDENMNGMSVEYWTCFADEVWHPCDVNGSFMSLLQLFYDNNQSFIERLGYFKMSASYKNVSEVITGREWVIIPELNVISLYPNPTTGELRIRNYELGIEGVEIYDIFGKKLSTFNYQLSTVNSIDISQLPAGIYFVRITTEKGVVTKKVVKK